MSDAPNFPQYAPPQQQGVPVAEYSHAKTLMRAIKHVAKLSRRQPKARKKKGLEADENIHIKHRTVKFY